MVEWGRMVKRMHGFGGERAFKYKGRVVEEARISMILVIEVVAEIVLEVESSGEK